LLLEKLVLTDWLKDNKMFSQEEITQNYLETTGNSQRPTPQPRNNDMTDFWTRSFSTIEGRRVKDQFELESF
jgi:hypothetical protein